MTNNCPAPIESTASVPAGERRAERGAGYFWVYEPADNYHEFRLYYRSTNPYGDVVPARVVDATGTVWQRDAIAFDIWRTGQRRAVYCSR